MRDLCLRAEATNRTERGLALNGIHRQLPPDAAYSTEFISEAEQAKLIALLDSGAWSGELKRRVQHFGYHYDYKARTVTSDAHLGPLPGWLKHMGSRLVVLGYFDIQPDQVIANEYMPGQGISAHVDCEPCFGDTVVSLSLLSQCEMVFRQRRSEAVRATILEPRSIIALKGAARYDWTHEIPGRKSDMINGVRLERSRRVSLTFRKITISL